MYESVSVDTARNPYTYIHAPITTFLLLSVYSQAGSALSGAGGYCVPTIVSIQPQEVTEALDEHF